MGGASKHEREDNGRGYRQRSTKEVMGGASVKWGRTSVKWEGQVWRPLIGH